MSLADQKILATILLEVLGAPKDHLKKVLEDLIKKMSEEKGIGVKKQFINEPTPLEENKNFYTTFAEVEVEVESLIEIMAITFKYMPSHIEIVSPEKLNVDNNFLNEFLNEIARRLHAYDEVARILQNERAIMEKQIKELKEKEETKEKKDSPK